MTLDPAKYDAWESVDPVVVATVRLSHNDFDAHRALALIGRWNPDGAQFREQTSKGERPHRGIRALGALADNSTVSTNQITSIVEYLDVLADWCHADIDEFTPHMTSTAEVGIGQVASIANVIVSSRRDCLDDIEAVRTVVVARLRAALGVNS